MRWILIVLLMCNGIYYLWHSYMVSTEPLLATAPAYKTSDAGAQIALLSERQSTSTTVLPEDNIAAQPAPVVKNNSPAVCWLIGPFKEKVSGKQVVGRLEALDISLRLINLTIDGRPDYWVHLPPQVSRRAAIKLLRELQVRKIDSFLITEGELENGISLGFYTRKDLAQKVFNERVAQGYNAKIKEIPRTHTQIWAVFDAGEYGKFSDELWEKIKEGNNALQRRKNYCDKIASADDLD